MTSKMYNISLLFCKELVDTFIPDVDLCYILNNKRSFVNLFHGKISRNLMFRIGIKYFNIRIPEVILCVTDKGICF